MLTIRLYLETQREDMRASVDLKKPSKGDRGGVPPAATAAAPVSKPIKPLNTWQLPFPGSANQRLTDQQVADEFGSLDLKGEGRLTYLDLLSSLRVREVQVDQATVQRWLKTADAEGKGYVDIRDYFALYDRRAAPNVVPAAPSYPAAAAASPSPRLKNPARASPVSAAAASTVIAAVDEEEVRLNALKQTFTSYDKDGDGFLSVSDVHRAFAEQGRDTDEQRVAEWVSRRDRSGHGAISLEDFVHYYRTKEAHRGGESSGSGSRETNNNKNREAAEEREGEEKKQSSRDVNDSAAAAPTSVATAEEVKVHEEEEPVGDVAN